MIRLLLIASAVGAIASAAAAQVGPPPPEYRPCEYPGQDRCISEPGTPAAETDALKRAPELDPKSAKAQDNLAVHL